MKVKQGKTLVYWSGSGKIVSNEDDANNNSDCNDIDANDGVSQISEKRTHKQANLQLLRMTWENTTAKKPTTCRKCRDDGRHLYFKRQTATTKILCC